MKRNIAIVVISLSLFAACTSAPKDQSQADTVATTAVADTEPQNQLTEQEKADGWKLLFNGENLDGWKIYKGKENNSWEVLDGTLHCKPFDAAEKRADIMTADEYQNFELTFDWKITPQGNSGVMFRVTEAFDQPYLSGPEYQVIDDKGYVGSAGDALKDSQLSAANYDMHATTAGKPVNNIGEWNTGKIVVNGNRVEHWLNGAKVVEYELQSDDWKNRKNASKWKDAKGYGMSTQGYIDFQDHGSEVWYRNIKIKTL